MNEPKAASRSSNASCVVLVPVGGAIEPSCEAGLRKLERHGYEVRRIPGYSQIDQARNDIVTSALSDGFEETMWIDSDTEFDPDAVDQLRAHDLPLVCGIYPKKGHRELACHVLPGTEQIIFGEQGGLVELLYAATGFLHVRRETYLQIQERLKLPVCNEHSGVPMIPFFQPMVKPHDGGHWYLGDDFSFCERARQAGFKIMADTTIRLGHIGKYAYRWEDAGTELPRYANFHFHLGEGN